MLLHSLNIAPQQKKTLDACIAQGLYELPESLRDVPRLYEGLEFYYDAFFSLHSCRQRGDGIGPIDWLAIDRYCERNCIEGEQYDDMQFFIGRMDFAFLEDKNEKMQAKLSKASPNKPKSRSKR